MTQVLAIDIGGTKLSCGVVSDEGELLDRAQTPTIDTRDQQDLYDALRSLIEPFQPFNQYKACGIGCAGPMRSKGSLVSPLNIPAWRDFPLESRIELDTRLPTSVVGDVQALAIGEGWAGAAVNVPNFMAMVVSTGVGGGIVLDGRLLIGREGNAGHIGHVVIDTPGRKLPGHLQGSLEAEASGLAIAEHTGRPAPEASDEVIAQTARLVGQAAGSTMNLLDLDLVVVGGGVALGFGDRFFQHAQEEVDRICQLDFSKGATIVPAGSGDEGPLIGAGGVGFRHLGIAVGGIS